MTPSVAPAPSPSPTDVLAALFEYYGPPAPRQTNGPLAGLIQTILSQNTSDVNTDRAFASLWGTFGSWEAIRAAPTAAVADAIRSGGLAEIKAPRIQGVLHVIQQDRGELGLDFLAELPLDDARAYLTRLNGVGPKTAACVLLFALGMPAMPVDTHVHRVSKRLGLIGPKVSAEAAHQILEASMPPDQMYEAHMLLIRHGRVLCKALRPRCGACPLTAVCPKVGVEA
ncbi:MAG: endonuclease III [Chloroflexi bacterium]|nr:endonuclease III [Chloroflexota bacterium]